MNQELKVKEWCQPTASWLPLKWNDFGTSLLAARERIYLDLYVSNARPLKLPRVSILRRLQEMLKHGYVERVGNAYGVTNKVNIPE
jgi:hypothetical protein